MTILRNILAVVVGLIAGSVVNMGIILVGPSVIPPPSGVDVLNVDSLAASIHLFEPKHFIVPFLAHALGTFVGALSTALIAHAHKMKLALGIGMFFLFGGIMNVFKLPSPPWFSALDLALAYMPMAFLAGKVILWVKAKHTHGDVASH